MKATLYLRDSSTSLLKYSTEMIELVDLIGAVAPNSATRTLTATNDYFGKTAEYYANTVWPRLTDTPDIIMVQLLKINAINNYMTEDLLI